MIYLWHFNLSVKAFQEILVYLEFSTVKQSEHVFPQVSTTSQRHAFKKGHVLNKQSLLTCTEYGVCFALSAIWRLQPFKACTVTDEWIDIMPQPYEQTRYPSLTAILGSVTCENAFSFLTFSSFFKKLILPILCWLYHYSEELRPRNNKDIYL